MVPAGKALEAAGKLAAKIAANGPLAVAASKAVLDRALDWSSELMFREQDKFVQPRNNFV